MISFKKPRYANRKSRGHRSGVFKYDQVAPDVEQQRKPIDVCKYKFGVHPHYTGKAR